MIIQQEKTLYKGTDIQHFDQIPSFLEEEYKQRLIRWYISAIDGDAVLIELTLDTSEYPLAVSTQQPVVGFVSDKSIAINIIPTGIGCSYGGFAADAAPVNNLLAKCVDYLICNPNTVNASNFVSMPPNVIYTEGYTIDQFCSGKITLCKPYTTKVGLIIEKTTKENLNYILNIANAVKAIHGVEIVECVVTDEDFGTQCKRTNTGVYSGEVLNTEVIINACKILVSKGVNAIAITSNIKDLPEAEYINHFKGNQPNPVGGVEAIISHLISRCFNIPAAHAPMINFKSPLIKSIVDPRIAGEYVSRSGLACILIGLKNAWLTYHKNIQGISNHISQKNVLALVAPASALGGIPMLYADKQNIPIIAVSDNTTILNVTQSKLSLKNVIHVNSYLEAAGVLLALKENICLDSVKRPLNPITINELIDNKSERLVKINNLNI